MGVGVSEVRKSAEEAELVGELGRWKLIATLNFYIPKGFFLTDYIWYRVFLLPKDCVALRLFPLP